MDQKKLDKLAELKELLETGEISKSAYDKQSAAIVGRRSKRVRVQSAPNQPRISTPGKKKKLILFSAIALCVLGGLSFILEIPTSFYDSDNDGVTNSHDLCPNTKSGATVNEDGCVDSDGDGVIDKNDACPHTPENTKVDSKGCPDSDGDGVSDSIDRCESTEAGTKVDEHGCPLETKEPEGLEEQIKALLDGKSVQMPKDANYGMALKRVRIKNARWEYQKVVNGPYIPIRNEGTAMYLNGYFRQHLKYTKPNGGTTGGSTGGSNSGSSGSSGYSTPVTSRPVVRPVVRPGTAPSKVDPNIKAMQDRMEEIRRRQAKMIEDQRKKMEEMMKNFPTIKH